MMNVYMIIDTNIGQCIDSMIWDGVSPGNLAYGTIAQLRDGSINIGDTVYLNGSTWVKFSII